MNTSHYPKGDPRGGQFAPKRTELTSEEQKLIDILSRHKKNAEKLEANLNKQLTARGIKLDKNRKINFELLKRKKKHEK